jgi:hypothetical protein
MSGIERWSPLAGVAAVALWIVGLAVNDAPDTSTKKTDAEILSVYQHHSNQIIVASWLFMLGCVCFVWFAGMVRSRLVEAENGTNTFSTLAFGGAVAAAVFGIGTMGGQMAVAINKNDVSPATAGALTHLSDAFFIGVEMTLIVLFVAVAVASFRTRVFPKWWAALLLIVAVVLVIGPIGWAAVIFATPIWTLGTAWMLLRPRGRRPQVAPAAA